MSEKTPVDDQPIRRSYSRARSEAIREQTDKKARSIIQAEADSRQEKTKRLRQLRAQRDHDD